MRFIPWTVDDEATVSKLIASDVDEFIPTGRLYNVGLKRMEHKPWCLKDSAIGGSDYQNLIVTL